VLLGNLKTVCGDSVNFWAIIDACAYISAKV